MSTYTEYCGLHQWDAFDRITRAGVNADNAAVDAALGGLLVMGSYTGDDAETQNIDLGFQPRAVLVVGQNALTATQSGSFPVIHGGLAMPGKPVYSGGHTAMELTDTGFAVHKVSGDGYIRINDSGLIRYYIAVR